MKRIFVLILLITACADAQLSVRNVGSEQMYRNISKDGFYIHTHQISPLKAEWDIVYFFANGYIYTKAGVCKPELLKDNDYLVEASTPDPNDKLGWGRCKVNEDSSIVLNYWVPSSGGGYPTVINSGRLINKTSFYLNSALVRGEQRSFAADTFHFRYYPEKPDSNINWRSGAWRTRY